MIGNRNAGSERGQLTSELPSVPSLTSIFKLILPQDRRAHVAQPLRGAKIRDPTVKPTFNQHLEWRVRRTLPLPGAKIRDLTH